MKCIVSINLDFAIHQKYLYGLTKEPKIRGKKVWIFNSTIYLFLDSASVIFIQPLCIGSYVLS